MSRANYQCQLLESLHATSRWENQLAVGWDIGRLDGREMILTLEEAIRRGRSEDPGNRNPIEILRGLGLLIGEDQIARAAVVLFSKGDTPQPDFPQLKLRLARFKGKDRNEFLDNRQHYGNAFELMRRAERFLIDWLPVASRIVPGRLERLDSPALPVEAVREALANAFVHRDYASGSGSIGVALYDDRLEISSPGELHFGLTPELLFSPHESKPWNPLIASTFYRRGHIEAWGRGTLKIAGLMREAGLPAPVVFVGLGYVSISFTLLAEPKETPGKTPGKTPDLIFQALLAEPTLSIPQLADQLRKSESAIERAIRKLRIAGKLARVGSAKTGYWKLSENTNG